MFSFDSALRGSANVGQAYNAGVEINQQQQARDEALKAAEFKRQQEATRQSKLVEALNSGDMAQAAATAYAYGSPEAGDGFSGLAKRTDDRSDKGGSTLANVAAGIATLPYEQRASALASIAPTLVARGVRPDQIAGFDPTDANLAAISGIDYTQEKRVDHAQEQYSNETGRLESETGQYEAETGRINANKPTIVGAGSTAIDPITGEVIYRAPDYLEVGLDQNLIEVGGAEGPRAGPAGIGANGFPPPEGTFAKMIHQESRGQHFRKDGRPTTSPAGAIGIAQVMPKTAPEAARMAGLPWDANRYRNDPEYNLALGQAYFNNELKRWNGDTYKAAASYNAGAGNVQKAIRRGGEDNYFAYLPKETQDYLEKTTGRPPSRAQRQARTTSGQTRVIQQGTPKPTRTGNSQQEGGSAQAAAATEAVDRAIRSGERLLQHPGMAAAVGSAFDPQSYGSINPVTGKPFAGTNAANFMAELEAMKAQVFLPMVQALKGMGQLSNAEGDKLTAAIGALDPSMSEEAFSASMRRVIADLNLIRQRAATSPRGGGGSVPASAVAALRANPNLRAQFDQKYGAGAAARVLGQ